MKHARLIRALSLFLAVSFLLAACGKDAEVVTGESMSAFGSIEESAVSVQEADIVSDSVVSADSFAMPVNTTYGWDPYNCVGMENRAVMQLVYEGLFQIDDSFEPQPCLCSSYTVSDDGMSYTLTLREAYFSDGTAVESSDVVHSYGMAAASEVYGSRFRDVYSVDAAGTDTVIITMNRPNDRIPCLFDFPITPSGSMGASALGTGPYARNGNDSLSYNTHWWGGNVPVRTISLYSSASSEDTRDHFEINEVHFVYNNPTSSTAASYHCDFELWNSNGTTMQYIGFNHAYGIFESGTARAAITYAIDRDTIANRIYHNYAAAASLPAHPSCSYYDETLAEEFSYDPAEALSRLLTVSDFFLPTDSPIRDLLNEDSAADDSDEDAAAAETDAGEADAAEDDAAAEDTDAAGDTDAADDADAADEEEDNASGYNSIVMLVMSGNATRIAAAKEVVDDLEAVGFTVELTILDEDDFYYYISLGAYDLYYADICLAPDFDLRSMVNYSGENNLGGFLGDDTLDDLGDSARENCGNRYEYYQYIMQLGVFCPILFENNSVFTTRGKFTGLNPSPDNLFYDLGNVTVSE